MEQINKTLQNIKVISKNFKCPRCGDDGAYSYFDWNTKRHKWKCPYCGKEDWFSNLNNNSLKKED